MIFFPLFWFFHLPVQTFSSFCQCWFSFFVCLHWFFCLSVLISFFILSVLIRDFQIIKKKFSSFSLNWSAKIMNQYRQNEEKTCILIANHESIQTEWRKNLHFICKSWINTDRMKKKPAFYLQIMNQYRQNEDLNTNRMKTWIQTKWRKIFA